MATFESIKARGLTYELNFDAEKMSHIVPKMSITSDAVTSSKKELNFYKGKPVHDSDLHITHKDKGDIRIEVWDTGVPEAGTLLAKGHYVLHNLKQKEGTFTERVTLKDQHGKHVGKALIEITVFPRTTETPLDETPQELLEELDPNLKKEIGYLDE